MQCSGAAQLYVCLALSLRTTEKNSSVLFLRLSSRTEQRVCPSPKCSGFRSRFMQINLCPRHLSPEFPPSKSLQLIRHSHRWRNRPKMTKLFTFLQLPSGSGHSPWCTAAVKQTWNLHQTTWWLFCRDGQVRSAHAEGDDFNNYMHWKLFQAVAQELFFCL